MTKPETAPPTQASQNDIQDVLTALSQSALENANLRIVNATLTRRVTELEAELARNGSPGPSGKPEET